MLPAMQRELALDYFGGGALNAVHLLGYLAGTLAAPLLARRLGMPRLSRAAHLVVAVGALACAAAPATGAGALLLALGRIATGLGAGTGIVAILVLALAAVPAASRGLVSALVWSGMGVAVILSGLAVPWLLETAVGWRVAFLLSALLAALVAFRFPPPRWRNTPQPTIESDALERFRPSELARPRWAFLVAVYFLFGVGYIAYSTFAGARLAAEGVALAAVSRTWIGFGAAMIAGALLSVVLLRFERSRRHALVAASLAGALGAWLASGSGEGAALGGALLVGLGVAATPALVSAYARERCSAAQYARAFSLVTAAMGVGQLIGPLAGGSLADQFGTVAAVHLALAAYSIAALLALIDGTTETRVRAGFPSRLS
jgi:MFS family permease